MSGLSRTESEVLATIAHAEELTPRDVALNMGMTTSNVAATLRELEAAGHITRARDSNDKRRVRLSVTASGRRLIEDYRTKRDSWLDRAVRAELTDEEVQTLLRAGELMQQLSQYESRITPWSPAITTRPATGNQAA